MNSLKAADPWSSSISDNPSELDPTSSEIDLYVIFLPVVTFMTFECSKPTNCHLNFKLDSVWSVLLTKVTLKILLLYRSFCWSNWSVSLK